MIYLTARDRFLDDLGELTDEQREEAIEAFDKTILAASCRLGDAINDFWAAITPEWMR